MARHRVFRTRAKCPGITVDLGFTATQHEFIGRPITFQRASDSEVNVVLDGIVVGQLDERISGQVGSALARGQLFNVVIEKAGANYAQNSKLDGAQLDLKVEYMLEKGRPAIDAPSFWRAIELPESGPAPTSFFTTVAGVTYEGRQRIVSRCSLGERLILVRDPQNRHDKGAINVMRTTGEQLGFIPAHVSRGGDSSGLAWRMDRGDRYDCRIKDLTGGGRLEFGREYRNY